MERAHVTHRWDPPITVQCDNVAEPKVHVAFDVLEGRFNDSTARIAFAPQTLGFNLNRYVPDHIRLGSPTRSPHEKKAM